MQKLWPQQSKILPKRPTFLSDFQRRTEYRIVRNILAGGDYPGAIFTENDILALGVIQTMREAGISIPGDIAVVGFDDIPFACFPEVQLTTIRQPKNEMGEIAVAMLFE